MTVESATYINGLNSSNPASGDAKSEGDDHLRLIKSVLKATFPNLDGAVTASASQLNHILMTTGGTMAGDIAMGNNDIGGLKTATFNGEYDAGNSGANKTIDWNNGGKQKLALTDNVTIAFTAPAGPTSGLILKIVQNASAAKSITAWPAAVEWPNSLTPTMSATLSRHDLYMFYYDGTTYYGTALQNYNLS